MKTVLSLLALIFAGTLHAQIDAKMVRYVDVSNSQIAFVYGGDIWLMPKSGGQATQLTNSLGEESFPKFSPDGREIAFTASYSGNSDVYVMPVSGGLPTRLTYGSHYDRMIDWHPDGKKILFASRREAGTPRVNQFFFIDKTGGLPERLDIPYGELASFSLDGNQLAYITKITENYPFKRYRGGLTSDILIYNFRSGDVQNITQNEANDGKPSWSGNKLYFLSDMDNSMRRNVWAYDTNSGSSTQITQMKEYDITYMSAGPSDLVFEAGGTLHTMNLSTQAISEVPIMIANDLSTEITRTKRLGNRILSMTASPQGNRVIFEERGELFDVPKKEGYTLNLTQSSGAFDRSPSWSPNGKQVAFWSDADGENNIHLYDVKSRKTKQLTKYTSGFGYQLFWSPNSKMISYIDHTNTIHVVDVTNGKDQIVDKQIYNVSHNGRFGFSISWSPDSRWITYSKTQENLNEAIFIYGLEDQQLRQVTSGYYSDYEPIFDSEGKYLYFFTNRSLNASYSDLDNTWIYPNSTQLAALGLTKDAPYLLKAKNDKLTPAKKEGGDKPKEDKKKSKSKTPEKPANKAVKINFSNMESRVAVLPVDAGNMGWLMSFDGKIVYARYPLRGDFNSRASLVFFDLKKHKEETIIGNFQSAVKTGDGKGLLVRSSGKFGLIKPAPKQKIAEPISTSDMVMEWNPKEEWMQIFNDTWRRHRDFFYDEDMHQVDWDEMRERYGSLIKYARTRWDVTNIQSNLVSELSAGHTYSNGGDNESVQFIQSGFLGIDWGKKNGAYYVKRIVRPAAWDTESRSPFDRTGSGVEAGHFIHSVNGKMLDSNKDPYAAFEGMNGKTVSLMVSTSGKMSDAKEVILECMSQGQENRLRYLEWIENNRKKTEELSGGKLGYIYMSNTGARGQLELVRMYYGQLDKKGFIIDERFNGGGQLSDRFLELLKRPSIYNLYWRHGKHHRSPFKTNTGPMGMLINGWAGSGGDALPWAFRELKGGPIVGERTLGILVGPATGHSLIDGGRITVPGARLYKNNGTWFEEGFGERPDHKVWDDPNQLMKGVDPQLHKVVELVMKNVNSGSNAVTPPPAKEDRTAKGFSGN